MLLHQCLKAPNFTKSAIYNSWQVAKRKSISETEGTILLEQNQQNKGQ